MQICVATIFFLLIFVFQPLRAADRGVNQWLKQWGLAGNDYASGVAADGSGGVFISGSMGGDIFLSKYDSSGSEAWTSQLGSADSDYSCGAALDNFGNVFVAGWTSGDFDDNVNIGQSDVFLAKFDSLGNKTGSVQFGTPTYDYATGIAVDASANIYVVGYTLGSLDGNINQGASDIFIVKYSSDGIRQWTRQPGTSNFDWGYGVTCDGFGNVYVTGASEGGLDGNINSGSSDAFVIKYDSFGVKQWTKLLGSPSVDFAMGITAGAEGNIFVAGYTAGSIPGNANAGNTDVFVAELNLSGEIRWVRQFGTPEYDYGESAAVDAAGSIYISGYTQGSFESHLNEGQDDIFLAKCSSTGVLQWTQQIGTSFQDSGNSVALDNAGNIFVAGDTYGDLDGYVSAGASDVFLACYKSCPVNYYAISGYVRDCRGLPLTGVTVSICGAHTSTCTVDTAGYYEFAGLMDCEDYTITPYKKDYSFSPSSLTIAGLDNNKYNRDFTGTQAFYVVKMLAASGQFNSPGGIAVDNSGNVYVSDTNDNCVKKIASETVSTIIPGSELNRPEGLAVNTSGCLYVADSGNNRVRKKDESAITTIFGSGGELNSPSAVAVDASGNVYVVDRGNNRVIGISVSGSTATICEGLNSPCGAAADPAGNVYVADTGNNRVKKIDTSGTTTIIAGTGAAGYSGDDESALLALLDEPEGVAVDTSGNVFVADTGNKCIRKINPLGIISTVVKNDAGSPVLLESPKALAVDSQGTLFVADTDTVKMCVLNFQPVLSFAYAGRGVDPAGGNSSITFVFKARYSDADGDAPLNGGIKLHILKNGDEISLSPFAMAASGDASEDYADGVLYERRLNLPPGEDYAYSFEAHDSNWIKAVDISGSGPIVKSVLSLRFPYTSGGVCPEVGCSTSVFTFRVNYVHAGNILTPAGWPKLFVRKGNENISGSPFVMQEDDGQDTDCADGKHYTCSLCLDKGADYEYSFESFEVNDSSTIALSATGPLVGPAVYTRDNVVLSNSVFYMNLTGRFLFELHLSDDSSVDIKILSPSGDVIKTLAEGTMPSGRSIIAWDGRNESGKKAGSGIYFIQTKTDTLKDMKKIAVLK